MANPFTQDISDTSSLPQTPPPLVWVVDDEAMVTASITTMLNLETDVEAISFNSPVLALETLNQGQFPDVVISDFLMPEMDGIAFLQQVRVRLPETTLILLTGYADKENAIQAINDVGIYRYIEKPWDNETLKLAIKNGIERTHLLKRLNEKIRELETAQADLQAYSEHLEERVTEKTHDLTLALNKLNAVVEHTGDGIVTVGLDGRIQKANLTFAAWLNTQAHLLEACRLEDVLHFQSGQTLEAVLSQDDLLLYEAHVGGVPVEVNLDRLPEDEGLVLVCRDIAKRKEAERLREDFVSTLTHDLRTPLLAAIQTLNFFLDGTLGAASPEQARMIEMLVGSNQQMLSLVNDLLEVYRYEAKQQRLILDTFALGELIHSVVLELNSLANQKKQVLSVDTTLENPMAFGDKQAIRRVITNLVGNAIHYTQEQGQITVCVDAQDEGICVRVQDNGRGIPPADLAKLFERFAQGTSKHRVTGTGLGLYLSKQIAEAHGGRIWAESTEGQGSTFFVWLPISSG